MSAHFARWLETFEARLDGSGLAISYPVDEVLMRSVDEARAALVSSTSPEFIGTHLEARAEGPHVVTHSFACTDPAYRGWYWVSVLSRTPDSEHVTVCETALLPGTDALLAPEWTPWKQRARGMGSSMTSADRAHSKDRLAALPDPIIDDMSDPYEIVDLRKDH